MVSPRYGDSTLPTSARHGVDAVDRVRWRCDVSGELIGRSDQLIDQSAQRIEQTTARLLPSEDNTPPI